MTSFDPLTITLGRGRHLSPDAGVCLLEAVARFAGESHSSHPACTCPVLAAYGRALNDRLMDEERQLLRPLIPQLVGTRSTPAVEAARCAVLVHDVFKHFAARRDAAVAALRKVGWKDMAARVEAVPAITDADSAYYARRAMGAVIDETWPWCEANDAADAAYAAAVYAADAAYEAADADADATVTAAATAAAAVDVAAAAIANANAGAGAANYNLSHAAYLAARRPAVDAAIATFVRAIQTTEAV